MTEQSTPRPDDAAEPLGGLTVEDELTPAVEERADDGAAAPGEPADDLQADEAHDFTGEVTRP